MFLSFGWLAQLATGVVLIRSFVWPPLLKRADDPAAFWSLIIFEAGVIGYLGWMIRYDY